jgi:hypothetical protein
MTLTLWLLIPIAISVLLTLGFFVRARLCAQPQRRSPSWCAPWHRLLLPR